MHYFATAFKLVVSQFVVANLPDGAGFMNDRGGRGVRGGGAVLPSNTVID